MNLKDNRHVAEARIKNIVLAVLLLTSVPAFADVVGPFFTPGNLVVVVSGCGVYAGTCGAVANGTGTGAGNSSAGGYGDNQASPLTLFQYTPTGTASVAFVNSLVLPQAGSGANLPVSAEYGSSSEGTLHLSSLGQYLTVMGYGIIADTFNANFASYSAAHDARLAQSGSLTGQGYTPIQRTVALIDPNGNVNSSTGLLNIFDNNNPRSVAYADETHIYVSGQGNSPDHTGGVFCTTLGSGSATPITGDDTNLTGTRSSQDTRDVQIVNSTLYVSVDSKEGSGSNRAFIGTLGSLPTSLFNAGNGPTMLSGFGNSGGTGKVTIGTSANSNGNNLNNTTVKSHNVAQNLINLSPVGYFFANATTLYVADSGVPKNDSNGDNNASGTSNIGNGGLQKWIFNPTPSPGSWTLVYTLYQGLNLVNNGNSNGPGGVPSGTSGLYGLAGVVNGATVSLYATNFTLSDLDATYLYGITDTLSNITPPRATLAFTQLEAAPPDSNFKGVSFAPSLPTGSATITSSPSGLAFTSTNTGCAPGTYTTPVTLVWTSTSSCILSVVTPQTGGPGAQAGVQYAFAQWENGANTTTNPSYTVTLPSSSPTYNASFTTQYQLTTSAGTGGSVSPGGFIDAGTNATITASPSTGYYFVNFTMGGTTYTDNPLSLPMNGPQSITANFAPQITPTITWRAPAAINYGSALSTTQLDASTGIAGAFVYTPPAGTVLPQGSAQTLSVNFTPTDTTHYTTATGSTLITVNPAAPSGPANLIVTKLLTRTGGNVVVQLTIANAGGTAAANVVLTSAKVGTVTATPLPQSLGTIAPGATAQATVSVPASVGASGAASSLSVSGTYTGGTFGSSARITLP